ncbi:hypothetical protein [Acidithiobacillus ferridurans]|uniref:Uncharacterized protein n=1 Tax=Acidithiobacillus ferridurans TaxID=1232575 RepID=A0A8X8G727_ACIFI|nr:hypothetical protein [Acidithiobacillus ferridurans]MBU2714949.1 hypothetical protein [Acidithiobacillus ferridurans]MBU2722789.1 hypothetical protein [Acidithiobacillus ferridurans]MBU2727823.1 hypothetical protein [Acidithiobacillus ferridurans]
MSTPGIEYSLNLSFTAKDLAAIAAAQAKVVIAKPADKTNQKPNVAWLAFDPMQNNDIAWEEIYGLYASNVAMEDGAEISKSSVVNPAVPGKVYNLLPDGAFGSPENGGTPDSFTVLNQYQNSKGYMVVGLTQDAKIGGEIVTGNAISAANVMLQNTAVMTPFTTVFIWLQSKIKSNSVCTKVTSPMTEVTFGGDVVSRSYRYDAETGMFLTA